MKPISVASAISLVVSIALAPQLAVADAPGAIRLDPVAGKEVCTAGVGVPNTPDGLLSLCVKKGLFTHDQYEVKANGAVILKGIDDETTDGVSGSYSGRPIDLKCTPVLSAPDSVTDSQIESIRKSYPTASRDQLKQHYMLLITLETGRHCVVRIEETSLLSVDLHFE
ncbi:hypothetical protein [Burkholderia sp. BE17]|uniref:hypothetical protein n=1 Tax=Burkholderia sp. BE17 TaxID=2656644 RepID=UPI00128D9AB0|nr:hypothetical protein [Burkholderia sp. BE17]MPV67675.1 hypothetical protein [Burkholderia sp. BE17]